MNAAGHGFRDFVYHSRVSLAPAGTTPILPSGYRNRQILLRDLGCE